MEFDHESKGYKLLVSDSRCQIDIVLKNAAVKNTESTSWLTLSVKIREGDTRCSHMIKDPNIPVLVRCKACFQLDVPIIFFFDYFMRIGTRVVTEEMGK
jgi:hypothetical protein